MKTSFKSFIAIIFLCNFSLHATNNYQTRIANFQKKEQLHFYMKNLRNEHNVTTINTVKKEISARKKIIEEFQAQGISLHVPETIMTITTQIPHTQYYVTSHIHIPALRTIITHTNPDSTINS